MPLLFSTVAFLGALLLFCAQPMIAKMVLPQFGGAPAVWNTCMVFFQAALLAGYGYAHASSGWLGARRQTLLHLGLLALPTRLEGTTTAGRPPTASPRRLGHDRELRGRVNLQRNLNSPVRLTLTEEGGAIDRIVDPDRRVVKGCAPDRLLADEAVVRKGFVQAAGDQILGLAIDLGQVVLRALEADLERRIEKAPARKRPCFRLACCCPRRQEERRGVVF